jgi:hypothetical protein
MAEHIPHLVISPAISMSATATINAGRLVESTGNMTVAQAAAASTKVVGVAAIDAVNLMGLPVYVNGIHDLTATGAIAAGDKVCAAANGTVQTIGANVFGTKVGIALEAIADTAKGRPARRPCRATSSRSTGSSTRRR